MIVGGGYGYYVLVEFCYFYFPAAHCLELKVSLYFDVVLEEGSEEKYDEVSIALFDGFFEIVKKFEVPELSAHFFHHCNAVEEELVL